MDYKALEDLVNILVRKSGLELKNNQKDKEKKELEERLAYISSKVLLLKNSDEQLELEYLLKEKELILSCLEDVSKNALTYAEEIMQSYKEKKPYSVVKDKVETLVSMAKKELEKTQSEIDETNIFTEMEKYNNKISQMLEEINLKDYKNGYKITVISAMNKYKDSKLKALYKAQNFIPKQIEASERIILELTSICEKLKVNRAVLMKKLNEIKTTFYSNLLNRYYKDNISEIKNIIKSLEAEIEETKTFENKYKKEIKDYQEQISKKQKYLIELEKNIKREEENIIPSDINNGADNLKDKIELLKEEDRLDSLTKEQQYLYVDSDVIKEEIELLWNKAISPSPEEEIDIF